MQMFTTLAPYRQNPAPEEMSDKSVIVSFTTRAAFEMDVPLPKNFKVVRMMLMLPLMMRIKLLYRTK